MMDNVTDVDMVEQFWDKDMVVRRMKKLEVENDELRAKLAAAEKDTARLDWLDENSDRLADALMTKWITKKPLRAAIDDAKGGE